MHFFLDIWVNSLDPLIFCKHLEVFLEHANWCLKDKVETLSLSYKKNIYLLVGNSVISSSINLKIKETLVSGFQFI